MKKTEKEKAAASSKATPPDEKKAGRARDIVEMLSS